MRDNWLSNRIFKSYDDIVDHCCYAWNTLVDRPWKILNTNANSNVSEFAKTASKCYLLFWFARSLMPHLSRKSPAYTRVTTNVGDSFPRNCGMFGSCTVLVIPLTCWGGTSTQTTSEVCPT